MSNPYQSPYQPPSQFSDPKYTPMPVRPAAGTVFGVLHLVFGIFGFFGLLVNAALMFSSMNAQMARNNPVFKILAENAVLRTFNQAVIILGFVAAVVLVIAGIGLLQQQPYGRNLSIGYAIYAIVMNIVGTILNVLFVFPPLIEQMNQANDPAAIGGAVGGMVGGVIGSCVGLVYPVLVLYFMYRPNMIEAYSMK